MWPRYEPVDWELHPAAPEPEPEAPEAPYRFVSGTAALELGTKEVKG